MVKICSYPLVWPMLQHVDHRMTNVKQLSRVLCYYNPSSKNTLDALKIKTVTSNKQTNSLSIPM